MKWRHRDSHCWASSVYLCTHQDEQIKGGTSMRKGERVDERFKGFLRSVQLVMSAGGQRTETGEWGSLGPCVHTPGPGQWSHCPVRPIWHFLLVPRSEALGTPEDLLQAYGRRALCLACWGFSYWFSQQQIFQISCSSHFLRANYHLQLCFISSQGGETSNWLFTSS